jgi:putative transposase
LWVGGVAAINVPIRVAPRSRRALRERLHALAAQRRRFGYRRLTVLLQREGLRVNHKRVYRLYRAEGLAVRRRKRKRCARVAPAPLVPATRINQRWAMDFMKLTTGRAFRVFNLIDEFRKALASEIDTSLPGARVVQMLERVTDTRGTPDELVVDNGPEFIGKALDAWAWAHGVRLHFIDPGTPVQNAYIESFDGRFRDACLNESWFTTLTDTQHTIDAWRIDFNTRRPHSSFGDRTPDEFEQFTTNRAPEPTLSS